MKTKLHLLQIALAVLAFSARGQGTFVYDQQSQTNRASVGGGNFVLEDQPLGQSFTPSLSGVGFVQFEFVDPNPANGLGASIFVQLWSGSISNGTLLGSTASVFMPDGFLNGVTNFFFPTPLSVTPGATYYLQPVVQAGSDDPWGIIDGNYNYPGGTAIVQGTAAPNLDLWFREGIVVPEPTTSLLILLGTAAFIFRRPR